jgi:hypothetical protein
LGGRCSVAWRSLSGDTSGTFCWQRSPGSQVLRGHGTPKEVELQRPRITCDDWRFPAINFRCDKVEWTNFVFFVRNISASIKSVIWLMRIENDWRFSADRFSG